MKSFIFLMVIGLVLGMGEVKGQLRLVGEKETCINCPKSNYYIVEILQDDCGDDYFIHYQEVKDSLLALYDSGIINKLGIKKSFEDPYEYPSMSKDKIITVSEDGKLRLYDYNLTLLKKISSIYTGIYPIKCTGNLITTDEYELSGTIIEIYSDDLLRKIKIVRNQSASFYDHLMLTTSQSSTFILIVPQTNQEKGEFFLLDSNSGEIKFHNFIDKIEYFSPDPIIIENGFILRTAKGIVAYDWVGKQLWEELLPIKTINNNDSSVYFFDKKVIFLIQNSLIYKIAQDDGKTLNAVKITDLLADESGYTLTGARVQQKNDRLIIYLSLYKNDNTRTYIIETDLTFKESSREIIDHSLEQVIPVFDVLQSKIYLITKSKTYYYEF